jgi:hypothetical protein
MSSFVVYLGWLEALLCELADLFLNFEGGALQPRRRGAFVRDAPLGDPLSGTVHATHIDFVCLVCFTTIEMLER